MLAWQRFLCCWRFDIDDRDGTLAISMGGIDTNDLFAVVASCGELAHLEESFAKIQVSDGEIGVDFDGGERVAGRLLPVFAIEFDKSEKCVALCKARVKNRQTDQLGSGFFPLALVCEGACEIEPSISKFWVDAYGAMVHLGGSDVFLPFEENISLIDPGLGKFRVDGEAFFESLQGTFVVAELVLDDSEAVDAFFVVGVVLQACLETFFGLLVEVLAQRHETTSIELRAGLADSLLATTEKSPHQKDQAQKTEPT